MRGFWLDLNDTARAKPTERLRSRDTAAWIDPKCSRTQDEDGRSRQWKAMGEIL